MAYLSKNIDDIGPEEWSSLLGNDYVLFVGSAVSIWHPSGLPNGKLVKDIIFGQILKEVSFSGPQEKAIRECIEAVPFEVIFGKCNDENGLKDWIYELYSAAKPNDMHTA